MKRTVLLVVAVIAVIAVAALGYAFFKPPEEASAPIQAAPVLVETGEPPAAATATAVEPTPTTQPTVAPEPTQAAATAEASPTALPEPEPTTAPAEPTADAGEPAAAASPSVFEIVQAESQARFIIDEVLRGAPKTVVGATDQVAGQIAVDPANPAATQLGEIKVNARTLVTDNEFRNRAVKNRILQTDAYEFVTFKPTALAGLPESITIGQPFSFQITGDLTIRDTTLPVTFEATVTPASETRLEGMASTTLKYADFGLIVPDAPAVNSVEDDVKLELEFVAAATS